MNESASEARCLMRFSVVDGAMRGMYDMLIRSINESATAEVGNSSRKKKHLPLARAFVTEVDGFFRRQIDDDEAIGTSLSRIAHRLCLAMRQDGVVVAHEKDGYLEPLAPGLADEVEAHLEVDALLEGHFVALLDRRSVGLRIAEGHTQLNNVSAALLEAEQQRDRVGDGGVAGGEEGDEDGLILCILSLAKESVGKKRAACARRETHLGGLGLEGSVDGVRHGGEGMVGGRGESREESAL